MGCACNIIVKESVKEAIEKDPSKATGAMAKELGVSEKEVISCLSDEMVKEVPIDKFEEIIEEVSKLGQLTLIVQNESTIFQVRTLFPLGSYGHGYYNLLSKETPIGGHIKDEELSAIFLVSKPFMGIETHSIQFFNHNGNAMFKLFLGRDENRQIIPEQMEKFISLKNRF